MGFGMQRFCDQCGIDLDTGKKIKAEVKSAFNEKVASPSVDFREISTRAFAKEFISHSRFFAALAAEPKQHRRIISHLSLMVSDIKHHHKRKVAKDGGFRGAESASGTGAKLPLQTLPFQTPQAPAPPVVLKCPIIKTMSELLNPRPSSIFDEMVTLMQNAANQDLCVFSSSTIFDCITSNNSDEVDNLIFSLASHAPIPSDGLPYSNAGNTPNGSLALNDTLINSDDIAKSSNLFPESIPYSLRNGSISKLTRPSLCRCLEQSIALFHTQSIPLCWKKSQQGTTKKGHQEKSAATCEPQRNPAWVRGYEAWQAACGGRRIPHCPVWTQRARRTTSSKVIVKGKLVHHDI